MGVENDLVLVFGSKLTWFKCGERSLLVFFAGIGFDLFCLGIENDLVLVF